MVLLVSKTTHTKSQSDFMSLAALNASVEPLAVVVVVVVVVVEGRYLTSCVRLPVWSRLSSNVGHCLRVYVCFRHWLASGSASNGDDRNKPSVWPGKLAKKFRASGSLTGRPAGRPNARHAEWLLGQQQSQWQSSVGR